MRRNGIFSQNQDTDAERGRGARLLGTDSNAGDSPFYCVPPPSPLIPQRMWPRNKDGLQEGEGLFQYVLWT